MLLPMTIDPAVGPRLRIVPPTWMVLPGKSVWLPRMNCDDGLAVMTEPPIVMDGGPPGDGLGAGGKAIVWLPAMT